MNNLRQESFIEHNKQYETTSDLSWHIREYKKNDAINLFALMGFQNIFQAASVSIKTHIDVGSGGGFLVNKACDYFDNVYGIEPSLAAIQIAKEITKDKKNITFINDGMIEGIKKVNIHNAPFLITTSAVLSHIDNIHVSYFLQQLNSLASIGSKFYFYEPYDKNIDVNLWHVRSKSWWIDRLPNWRIKFLDLPDCGYKKGIEGEFLGINCQALNNSLYSSSFASNLLWNVSGHWYKLRYAISRFVK